MKVLDSLPRVVYVVFVLVLTLSTWIGYGWGHAFAKRCVYGHGWFVAFCLLTFSVFIFDFLRRGGWRRLTSVLFTLSISFIALGAFLTYSFSDRGYVHLRKGVSCSSFEVEGGEFVSLPFSIRLDSFCVRCYPGTDAPMDYVSYVVVEDEPVEISMNRNYWKGAYRFCQSGFDEDGSGSRLSVCYDPLGGAIVFSGYLLFGVAALLLLFAPGGRFRRMLRNPLLKGAAMLLLFCHLSVPSLGAAALSKTLISEDEALELRRMQVLYQDRVVPLNTVAVDFVKKVSGSNHYRGLLPEQVLAGWQSDPSVWRHERMIKVKSPRLRRLLNMDGEFCSMAELYDARGRYQLHMLLRKQVSGSGFDKLEKEAAELDEKVGIIMMVCNGNLFKPLPVDGSVRPLSEAELTAELIYNSIPLTKVLFMFNLSLGILSCLVLFLRWRGRVCGWLYFRLFPLLLFMVFAAMVFYFGLRWYIGGRIPLSNGYETMHFFSLVVVLLALLLVRRYPFIAPFGFFLSGVTLLVAYLGEMNPAITPLVPVLNSPWLSSHVSTVMLSYALFAFIMLNSLYALLLMLGGGGRTVGQLTLLNKVLLYPATILMAVGIALGSVWANGSWGSYWGWDPKEVWALVTLLLYAAPLLFSEVSFFRGGKTFHLYLLLAFSSVLMTYFGVNYLLGGLHSYGG